MGFLDKIRAVGGGVSPELMQNGTLARGQIAGIQPTGMTVSHGNDALGKQVCNVALDVFMDNTPPYRATCHQGIPILALQALMTAGSNRRGTCQSAESAGSRNRLRQRAADRDDVRRRTQSR